MKTAKRLLALLLAVILSFGAVMTTTAAESVDGYTCEINDEYMLGTWSGEWEKDFSKSTLLNLADLGSIQVVCEITFDRYDKNKLSSDGQYKGAWHISEGSLSIQFFGTILKEVVNKYFNDSGDGLLTKTMDDGWFWIDPMTGKITTYQFEEASGTASSTDALSAFVLTSSLNCKEHKLNLNLSPSEIMREKTQTIGNLISLLEIDITAKQENKSDGHYAVWTRPAVASTYTKKGTTKHQCCMICGTTISGGSEKAMLTISKPTLKTCSMTSSGVKLTWGSVTGATHYQILRGTSSVEALMSVVKTVKKGTTSCYDTGATSGKTYYYRVRAVAKADNQVKNSSKASAYKSVSVIMPPTDLKATNLTSGGIKLTWTAPKKASGFIVYRKAGTGSWSKIKTITSGSTTSYTDKDRTSGTAYQYKVYAYYDSTATKSPASKIVTKVFMKRPTIKSLSSSTAKKLKVTWSRDSKATGYQIKYSKNSDFEDSKTVTYTGTASTASKTISSLTGGKKYYVKIRSYKTYDGTKYYSTWSAVKNCTVKK